MAHYYVSTHGNDQNTGTQAAPLRTIQYAADLVEPGDTVFVAPGTYNESITLRRGGTKDRPITFQSEKRFGAIINGEGKRDSLFVSDETMDIFPQGAKRNDGSRYAKYITVRGFVFEGAKATPETNDSNQDLNAAVRASAGWILQDCKIANCDYQALDIRDYTGGHATDFLVNRVVIENTGGKGAGCNHCDSGMFKDCIIRRANLNDWDTAHNTSSSKCCVNQNIIFDGLTVYDGNGMGIWWDIFNENITIRNCTSFANHGKKGWAGGGAMFEISGGPALICNNLFHSNSGPGLLHAESGYKGMIYIIDNLFQNNREGIDIRCMQRPDPNLPEETCYIMNATIRNNQFKNWKWIAWGTGMIDERVQGVERPADINFSIDCNLYEPGEKMGLWNGKYANSLEEMQQLWGCEKHGIVCHLDTGVEEYPLQQDDPGLVVDPTNESLTIDSEVKTLGQTVAIPVFRRGEFYGEPGKYKVDLFDLQARAFTLENIDYQQRRVLEKEISVWTKSMTPKYVQVTPTLLDEYDYRGTFAEI